MGAAPTLRGRGARGVPIAPLSRPPPRFTAARRGEGGKEVTLGPGQTFYESPEDVHTVSRNASTTKFAQFLVIFVKQKGAPLTVPAK